MIIATASHRKLALPWQPLLLPIIALIALAAAEAAYQWQEFAAAYAVYGALIALAAWRPRYGLYAVALLAIMLESQPTDPIMYWGWVTQFSIATWSNIPFLTFTPIELLLAITVISAALHGELGRGLPGAHLKRPLLFFVALVVLSFLYGVLTGGSLTVAIWEVRALVLAGVLALLVPKLLTHRGQVEHLIVLLCIAMVLLSLDIIWRRFTLLANLHSGQLDGAFDHESPIFINFMVVLLVARLVWPATGRQRLAALAIPLVIYAEMLTERRAGWIGLDLGLAVILIFTFRLQRKFFYLIGLPLILVYSGYLGAFWNAQGTLGQPARAVRSIVSPDPRDEASNLYRVLEAANIRQNIRDHPFTGVGFGHTYVFYYPLPDLSFWRFWHYTAHNTMLWVWMDMGPLGFIAFLVLIATGIVYGVQVLRRSSKEPFAPIIVALVSGLIMVAVYSYVDLGLTSVRMSVFFGILLGVIGMLGHQLSISGSEAG